MNRRLMVLGVLALLSACSGNLTVGGLTGEATVVVSGDADDTGAASPRASSASEAFRPSLLPIGRSSHDDGSDDSDEAEGEIEAELALYLVALDGSVVSLTDREIRVDVDVQGRNEFVAVEQRTVPARSYRTLRVVFSEFEIDIESGLVVGGIPILGAVEVELEADSLVVERPLQLAIDEGEDVQLLVDLNARAWLLAVDPILQTVSDAELANAISVSVR